MNLTKHRVLLGTLFRETNTFSSGRKVLGDFSISVGDELFACRGDGFPLSGKGFSLDPGPVTLKATLLRRTDGNVYLEDRHSHAASLSGIHTSMGPCAVVEHQGCYNPFNVPPRPIAALMIPSSRQAAQCKPLASAPATSARFPTSSSATQSISWTSRVETHYQ